MKYRNLLLIGIALLTLNSPFKAQNCVQCNGSSVTGTNASAVGNGNTASGNNSFAGGYLSKAKGSNSFAFGYKSIAQQSTTTAIGNTVEAAGVGSMALGTYVKATSKNALAFGCGTTSSYPLTNSTPYSIAFGVNSNIPTMLITKALNNNFTGKVAIGNITSPEAKLHIKSDENEDASVFVEPSDKTNRKASLRLFDNDHSISVDHTAAMTIRSSKSMDLRSSNITLSGKIGINTDNNTDNYALAVDGGIISTKVYIKEVNQWPDHVFAEGHELLDLHELKEYLSQNKHLPGIPSEEEVIKNGYDLHEMQYLLLEKIEELTQYILLLQEEINDLHALRTCSGDSIQFTYDANGNRVLRSLIIEKAPRPDMDSPSQTDFCEVFPNPTPGTFTVFLREQVTETRHHARLLSAAGVVLEEKDLVSQTSTFDLSAHPSGVYILEIEMPEETLLWKIIKN